MQLFTIPLLQKGTGTLFLVLLFVAGVVVVGIPSAAAEQIVGGTVVGDAPADDCDPKEKGAEILQAAKNMTDAACTSSALVASDQSGIFSAAVKAQLDDACTRSQNWVNATGRASDFAKMGKKGTAECHTVEIEGDDFGDDDGICSKSEMYSKKDDKFGCVEDDTDGIGDDDGVCELLEQGHGKKVWEACLQECDTPDDNPAVTDCTTMDQMAGTFQDAADALGSANTQIAVKLNAFESLRGGDMLQMPSEVTSTNECLTASSVAFEGFSFPNGSRSSEYTELRDALLAAEVLEGIANYCVDAADTTIFGTDAPAVCIVAHAGQVAASTISAGWELLDDAITGARVDKVSLCVEDMGTQLNAMDAKLDAMQEQLDAMDAKLDFIIELLNTPQGRRPNFPIRREGRLR